MNHLSLFSSLHYEHTTYNAICLGSRTLLRVRNEKKSPVCQRPQIAKASIIEHQSRRLRQPCNENTDCSLCPEDWQNRSLYSETRRYIADHCFPCSHGNIQTWKSPTPRGQIDRRAFAFGGERNFPLPEARRREVRWPPLGPLSQSQTAMDSAPHVCRPI